MSALTKLDEVQKRSRSTAVAVATAKKFSEDQSTNPATMIAFWAFFSIFPLLLVDFGVLDAAVCGIEGDLVLREGGCDAARLRTDAIRSVTARRTHTRQTKLGVN